MGPKYNDRCSIRNAETEEKTHRRGEGDVKTGRDLSDVATSQGISRMAGSHQKWERQGRILSRAFQGNMALLTP